MALPQAAFNTGAYDPEWPIANNRAIRCVVRVKRDIDIPIVLDHRHKIFMTEDRGCFGRTPYELLRHMASAGHIRQTMPAENWGRLYFTADDGRTWIQGRELRRFHAAQHGRDLVIGRRRLLPAAV